MLFEKQKLACATCIKGHRSSQCKHHDRPLFAIRAKGRPVSQCDHCRELRRVKQVHVKCECASRPVNGAATNPNGEPIPGTSLIVARKGAKKVKTLEAQTAAFPNGISDIVEAATVLSGLSDNAAGSSTQPNCQCDSTGECTCTTDRYISRKARSASKTHSARPSISLTIPPQTDSSNNPATTTFPLILPSSPQQRSHSRSPSRTHQHHASDGHQIGGDQTTHLQHHLGQHYSPYQSPGIAGSASPQLLVPGADWRDLSSLSLPASPLSVDSAVLSTGRNSPVDFGLSNPSTSNDWAAALSNATAGLAIPSPVSPMLDSFASTSLTAQQQQQLSPDSAYMAYRQAQEGYSPVSPASQQFMNGSPMSPNPIPSSNWSLFDNNPQPQQQQQQQPQYENVFTDDQEDDQSVLARANMNLLGIGGGLGSRRGSHHSIGSSHSGFVDNSGFMDNGPPSTSGQTSVEDSTYSNNNNANAYAPHSPSPKLQPCANSGRGCHCWSGPTDSQSRESRRCNVPGCPCCSYFNTVPDVDLSLSGLGFQALLNAANIGNPSMVQQQQQQDLLIPTADGSQFGMGRARSSSASNFQPMSDPSTPFTLSNQSTSSVPSISSLGRANSTGHLGGGSGKYKNILPKRTPISYGVDPSSFTFPRAPPPLNNKDSQTQHHQHQQQHQHQMMNVPPVIVTPEASSSGNPSYAELMNMNMNMDEKSLALLFPSSPSKHTRNLSQPVMSTSSQHHNRTLSASHHSLLEPKPLLYTHARSSSEGRGQGSSGGIELIVTPASPFDHKGMIQQQHHQHHQSS